MRGGAPGARPGVDSCPGWVREGVLGSGVEVLAAPLRRNKVAPASSMLRRRGFRCRREVRGLGSPRIELRFGGFVCRRPVGAGRLSPERWRSCFLGGSCSSAGWWCAGERLRRWLSRVARVKAADPDSAALWGFPRPTSHKEKCSAAARRATSSAHKATDRDEALRFLGKVALRLALRRALRRRRSFMAGDGVFGSEDPRVRVVFSVFFGVFFAVVLGRVSRWAVSSEFERSVRVI